MVDAVASTYTESAERETVSVVGKDDHMVFMHNLHVPDKLAVAQFFIGHLWACMDFPSTKDFSSQP